MRKLLVLLALFASLGLHAQSLIQQGDSCRDAFDDFEALDYYIQAQKQHDDNAIRQRIAGCHFRRANYRGALSLLSSIPTDSLSHESFRQLFYCYKYLADKKKQVKYGKDLVLRFPNDSEITAELIRVLNLDDGPTAEQSLNYARFFGIAYLSTDSTNIAVRRQLADTYYLSKEYGSAESAYRLLIQQGDSTYANYLSLGICAKESDHIALAQNAFEKAIAFSDSTKASPLYHLAQIYLNQGKDKKALSCINKAVELSRPDPIVQALLYDIQGRCYFNEKNYRQAIYAFQEVLKYNGNSLDANYGIADAFRILGDEDNAKEHYQNYLSMIYLKEGKLTEQEQQMKDFAEKYIGPNFRRLLIKK